MKNIVFALIGVFVCAACMVGWDAGAAENVSPEVCKALQDYVSKVDSARSVLDPVQRKEIYREAQSLAAMALKKHKAEYLLDECASYAVYVEGIIVKDATDPGLPDLMEKRVKLREKLLGLCPM